jgi:hypothetical protein
MSPLLLWGLLAATIPIIIHLISLSKTKEMEFSSIRLLEEMKHESIRKLKIKQWLLVLLRTLMIISLVLMIARPTTKGFISSWLSGDVDSRAVVIIDNSASMSLMGDNGSLLENIKLQSKSLIRKLDEKSFVEIYQSNPMKLIYSGKLDRAQRISNAINSISQTATTDQLWSVIITAIKSAEQHEINKECFIFSDLQSLPDTSTVNQFQNELYEWKLYFIGQEPVQDNIGIYEVLPVSQVKLPDHLMKLNTRVKNEGKIEKRNISIELYLNNERVGQVVTAFNPTKAKEFIFQAYPGKSGIIRGKMTIPDDDFDYDNYQSFELSIPKQISCMLIGESVEDVFLLEEALQSINGENEYIFLNRKIMPAIEKIFLEDTDVLILHRPDKISMKALDDIQRFIARGGGLIWISNTDDIQTSSSIESALKLPYYVQSIHAGTEAFYEVERTQTQHALFDELTVRKLSAELPEVYSYTRVRPRLNQNIILAMHNGDPFLIEYRLMGGHVYYFSSPFGLDWNDLALRGLFVPLLHRMLILLATDESNTMPVYAGESKKIIMTKEFLNAKWEMYSPSGRQILLIPDYNKEVLIVENTDELGSYEIYANGEFYTAFSTRLAHHERPINRVPGQLIANTIGSTQAQYISPGQSTSTVLQDLRYGKALWRNFLILAIIIFLIETIMGKPHSHAMKSED